MTSRDYLQRLIGNMEQASYPPRHVIGVLLKSCLEGDESIQPLDKRMLMLLSTLQHEIKATKEEIKAITE